MALVHAILTAGPGLPEGDLAQTLRLHGCLTAQGTLDAAMFAAAPEPWLVERGFPDRDDWTGELVQVDDGLTGAPTAWAIRSLRGDNEPLWVMDHKLLRPGDYLTLRRPDGEQLVFRIVGVDS